MPDTFYIIPREKHDDLVQKAYLAQANPEVPPKKVV
jgi:hypothetical protein